MTSPGRSRPITSTPFNAPLEPEENSTPRDMVSAAGFAMKEVRRRLAEGTVAAPVVARRLYQIEAALDAIQEVLRDYESEIRVDQANIAISQMLIYYTVGRVEDSRDIHVVFEHAVSLCGRDITACWSYLSLMQPDNLCCACAEELVRRFFDPVHPDYARGAENALASAEPEVPEPINPHGGAE